MAIERAILANLHKALEEDNKSQTRKAAELLGHLGQLIEKGFIDYSDFEQPGPIEGVKYNYRRKTVTINDRHILLSRKENELMRLFLVRPNETISVNEISKAIWEKEGRDCRVRSLIEFLRNRIERDPRNPELIINHWGRGYSFTCSTEQADIDREI